MILLRAVSACHGMSSLMRQPHGHGVIRRSLTLRRSSLWSTLLLRRLGSAAGERVRGTVEEGGTQGADSAPSSPATPDMAPVSATGSGPASVPAVGVEFCTPPTDARTNTDGAPRRYRTVANTLATTTPVLDFDYSNECLMAVEEPASFTEAEKQAWWRKAMIEEMNAIKENNTWYFCDLPPGLV